MISFYLNTIFQFEAKCQLLSEKICDYNINVRINLIKNIQKDNRENINSYYLFIYFKLAKTNYIDY